MLYIACVILHCALVSPEAKVVVALDHGPPRMRVPLANPPPHEYVLSTLLSKYIVVKHTVSLWCPLHALVGMLSLSNGEPF
jgi:hypothetical protein